MWWQKFFYLGPAGDDNDDDDDDDDDDGDDDGDGDDDVIDLSLFASQTGQTGEML